MIRRAQKRLTAAFCKATHAAGKYGDGNGLRFYVKPTGTKSWVQRLVIHGKRYDMGLGGFPLVGLAEARQKAFDNRKLARDGGDPRTLTLASQIPVFADAAAAVIALHAKTWTDTGRSEKQWQSSLRDYAFPVLADKRVDLITTADVMEVLTPIWAVKARTAGRVRQRISAVMKWAIAQGYRPDNPAGDAIGAALPKNEKRQQNHHKAVPYVEVGATIDSVRAGASSAFTKLAIEFLILTAARSGEVRKAQWSEIDLHNAVWTVPADRMKTGREHRVPLSARALEILDEAKQISLGSDLIFPSFTGRALSSNALQRTMIKIGTKATIHGMRSAFRDWASERTNAPRAVCEAALAHVTGDKVEAAYARSDLFEKRRDLMESWAAFVAERSAVVVRLHG